MYLNENLTIAWDGTPLDGDHINEAHINVHINGETVPYVMQVDKLVGDKMI